MKTNDETQMSGQQENDNYTFMTQEVKPKRKRKYLKKLLSGALIVMPLAILFGFLAFLSFRITQKYFYPVESTTVMEGFEIDTTMEAVTTVTDTTTTETTTEESTSEDTTEPEVTTEEPTTEDPIKVVRDQYSILRGVAGEANKSIVTVTAVTNGSDWFLNDSEKTNSAFGLILSENSRAIMIVTPYDNVSGANEVRVTFRNGSVVPAEIYNFDTELGVCCLSVNLEDVSAEAQLSYEIATLGDSTGLDTGVPVIAVGNPNGYMYSMEVGIISNRKTTEQITDGEIELFNTNLSEKSNGAGVIVDLTGAVVGFMTHRFNSDLNRGLSTCYSVNGLRHLLEDLAVKRNRPYLGIYGGAVQPEMAGTLGVGSGIYISRVITDSPAFVGGLERGDIITSVNGTPISDFTSLSSALRAAGAESTVKVDVVRTTLTTDNEMTFEVTLGTRE